MNLNGNLIIGLKEETGSEKEVSAKNPSTNDTLSPGYKGATAKQLEHACELANNAFYKYKNTSFEDRAKFLDTIAEEIEAVKETLLKITPEETGLPEARITGETGRTVGQLRMFAEFIRNSKHTDATIDEALPDRQPLPRPDLRLRNVAIGPVAVFGASNFPLAFSVAGGDTASALAAGCPVIVKAHSSHPRTSEIIGRCIQNAVKKNNLPDGTFSLLFGSGNIVGQGLVKNKYIKAVGFTGSRNGGLQIVKTAQSRNEPIPVYAEMSSINPVFVFNSVLENPDKFIEGFLVSLQMGAGQFCTNPGLIITQNSKNYENFKSKLAEKIKEQNSQTMLSNVIAKAYEEGVSKFKSKNNITLVGEGKKNGNANQCIPHLFETSANEFKKDQELSDEIFGSTSLIIKCENDQDFNEIAKKIEGQLTISFHSNNVEEVSEEFVSLIEDRAGRIIYNQFPTGVEVCHAMVHGGPFPATSDTRTTSVGSKAIFRFLRPVSYQNIPSQLLPKEIK